MTNAIHLIQGTDYDCAAQSIRCRADRVGATVYEAHVGNRIIRVLAHDESDVSAAAQAYLTEEQP
jgi:hypothetical protein